MEWEISGMGMGSIARIKELIRIDPMFFSTGSRSGASVDIERKSVRDTLIQKRYDYCFLSCIIYLPCLTIRLLLFNLQCWGVYTEVLNYLQNETESHIGNLKSHYYKDLRSNSF